MGSRRIEIFPSSLSWIHGEVAEASSPNFWMAVFLKDNLMLRTVVFLFFAVRLLALADLPDCGVYGEMTVATNHADDLAGSPDTRPDTWGLAAANEHVVVFVPPEGCHVRILRVYGDVVAWPKEEPEAGKAGVLWGLRTTASDGSRWSKQAADNTFLYYQFGTRGEIARISFDVQLNNRLGDDNTLISKVAAWLNTTGQPIHIEPSFVIVFRFE